MAESQRVWRLREWSVRESEGEKFKFWEAEMKIEVRHRLPTWTDEVSKYLTIGLNGRMGFVLLQFDFEELLSLDDCIL